MNPEVKQILRDAIVPLHPDAKQILIREFKLNDNTSFPKSLYKCDHCGHVWNEFIPMKCPSCDNTLFIRRLVK